jgi:type I restriction enzyme S subunit
MMELPKNWVLARLDQIGIWSGGGTPSKSNSSFWDGNIPWVSPKDMKVAKIKDTIDHITPEAVENSAAKIIPPNSVLIVTRSGILAHSFPVAITDREVTINQDLKALTPEKGINPEYVAWVLNAFQQDVLNKCSKDGTTVHSIEMPRFMAYQIPIAPTNEQKRVVDKVEELISQVEEGERCLSLVAPIADRALGLANSLRVSILKKAFSGRLVAQDQNDEPASVLLERICAERQDGRTTKRRSNKNSKKEAA